MSEIRSILQGLVGKIAIATPQNKVLIYENRDLSPAPPMCRHKYASINFGRFYEKYKLSLASLYLDGEALEWYQWLFRKKQLSDWKHFTAKVMIQFRKQHLESQRCHLLNNWVTSVIDYQSCFEDVSSGYGDFNVLTSDIACVSSQQQNHCAQVFDDLSERPTDANSINISCKLSQLEVEDPHKVCKLTIRDTTEASFPYDLAYFVSPTAKATACENDVKSEDKNDEEEIVTIRNGKVYPQHGLGIAQCWKKMSSIPSTCSYPNLITRGITNRLGHDFLDCGDSVLNHFVVSLWVQTFQPWLPRPLSKPPFSVSLLNFLAQIEKSVEIESKFDFDGLVIIGEVDSKTIVHLYAANLSSKMQWKVLKLRNRHKLKLQVVHLTGYTIYGAIERVDLVVLHILLYDLIAMERHGQKELLKLFVGI
ncbi:hypothetical protein H5410_046382 [Solanum commersonii]|uniref:Retrotransposon gag domain-containing protein n=1 Tax=Solanum commersonii TaxID=4109 RepID=A0A9J5XFC9_SOLCO|nr:hypothetical protein H5410_046382 [Solanum commersonii]